MIDSLGDRMKRYEMVSRSYLTRRTPVAIRLDGRAFHTFTKGFKKPFDPLLIEAMNETMKYLCENIQGCVLGYTQSDEITLILQDYAKLETDAWFDYNVQKMASIAASMATLEFNRMFEMLVNRLRLPATGNFRFEDTPYVKAMANGATFDARCFNIPKEEVTNLLLWRQKDAIRNSISSVAQSLYSAKQLHGKNSEEKIKMIAEKGYDWNSIEINLQRGSCCVKNNEGKWGIDYAIPIFIGNDRDFVEKLINFDQK